MSHFEFSSDPHSGLNRLRYRLHKAREAMKKHNREHGNGGRFMGEYSRALAALRHEIKGVPRRRIADFSTEVDGIPCGVVVKSIYRGQLETQTQPAEAASVDFDLIDRKGYDADWLKDKLTEEDAREIMGEALERDDYEKEEAAAYRQELALGICDG